MDLKVFITPEESVCDECGEQLGRHAWITLVEAKAVLCLSCADLDHLIFLPSGDAALTRRAGKYSTLSAVVLKWSRARKRYERQGLLVEEAALQRAEEECLADEDRRARRREREAEHRLELDQVYIPCFAASVRELFPNCPAGREQTIAEQPVKNTANASVVPRLPDCSMNMPFFWRSLPIFAMQKQIAMSIYRVGCNARKRAIK